jgi:hypothetical protein
VLVICVSATLEHKRCADCSRVEVFEYDFQSSDPVKSNLDIDIDNVDDE